MSVDAAALAGRPLSRREEQVLGMLAEGHRMAAIAEQLYVSVTTAKRFGESLFAKLEAHTAAQAVAVGYQSGYLAVSPELSEDLAIIRSAREMGYGLAVVKKGAA